MNNKIFGTIFLTVIIILSSCEKFLEEKSDKRLATPNTIEDYQALLDRTTDIQQEFAFSGEASADNYYLPDAVFNGLSYQGDKNLYTWQPDNVSNSFSIVGNDWGRCYKAIYISNSILYELENKNIPNSENVKGQALAYRAFRYLDGAQIWTPAYNNTTASVDLGMPLRLDPDMSIPSVRSTVQQTYERILKDLRDALPLLPNSQISPARPSKAAVYGLLARTYLFMGDYNNAFINANEALKISKDLIDYNTLNQNDANPIKDVNIEVIFRCGMGASALLRNTTARIPLDLYNSFVNNDLRKVILFRKNAANEVFFKGNYTGQANNRLTGIATNELYLIVAESLVRLDRLQEASEWLNNLLVKRWKTGTFIPYNNMSKELLLNVILQERRKELLMRGLRWADLKRFNRDGANIILSRTLNGQTFTLAPNDPKYAIAIPEDVIEVTGMPQNPR